MRKLAIVAIGACAACSLLVDTDDLDKPAAILDGGKDSASIVPAEASVVDGSDGKAPDDSGLDGSATNDAGTFCESHASALFCDDFDQPNRTDLRTEGWSGIYDFPLPAPQKVQAFSAPQGARVVWNWADRHHAKYTAGEGQPDQLRLRRQRLRWRVLVRRRARHRRRLSGGRDLP